MIFLIKFLENAFVILICFKINDNIQLLHSNLFSAPEKQALPRQQGLLKASLYLTLSFSKF